MTNTRAKVEPPEPFYFEWPCLCGCGKLLRGMYPADPYLFASRDCEIAYRRFGDGMARKREARAKLRKGPKVHHRYRNLVIYHLRKKGWSIRDLARKYGISATRISQIIKKHYEE